MLITFSTVEAVKNNYQNDLVICGLLTFIFFGFCFFVKWEPYRLSLKWNLFWSCLFLFAGWLLARTSTVDNFVEAKVEPNSITLKFANLESPVVLTKDQLLDVSIGFAGRHRSNCYLIVVPKEGWHYSSSIISNECSGCEKYRDQARAILKLNAN